MNNALKFIVWSSLLGIGAGCAELGLDKYVHIEAGRDTPGHPKTMGLLDTAMEVDRLHLQGFTPAEEEMAQKALTELQDGETISWENPHFGTIYFGPPKSESEFWDPEKKWRSTWQNEEGLTCRYYDVRYKTSGWRVYWRRKSHNACLKNGRWVPDVPDNHWGVSSS